VKLRAGVVAVVLVVVGGVAVSYLFLTRAEKPGVAVGSALQPFFDSRGRLAPGAFAAAYSPDGAHLAVRSADGIGLAEHGQVRPLTPSGSHVVDFAWTPSSDRLLVAEGPIPTGRLDALGLDGLSAGKVTLAPSFSVGSGFGMAVDSTTRHAVVTRAVVDALGGEVHLDLVEVDLQSGAVRVLTETPSVQESDPFYIDDQTVLFQRQDGSHSSASVLDLGDLAVRDLTGATVSARPVGVIYQGTYAAYATPSGDLYAVAPGGGAPILLGSHLGAVAAIDPTGARAVIVSRSQQAAGVDQLVERRVTPPPKKAQ
jgi:hypothetical protein